MLYIGICDDDEGVCAELERMLYDYAEQNKIQMDIDIWHRGESLCRFLREKEQISEDRKSTRLNSSHPSSSRMPSSA